MEPLLTPDQIAAKLGIKLSTVYQWTHQGFIPHIKLGKLVRFREPDIVKWLEGRAHAGRKTRKLELEQVMESQSTTHKARHREHPSNLRTNATQIKI